MIKYNRYLKTLGIRKDDFPFELYSPKDVRYKDNDEGFSVAEFFNLNNTLDLIIYSYLCEFYEKYSDYGYPARLKSSKQWKRILRKKSKHG